MNQPISPPASFLSFKRLGTAPTIPKKISPPLLSFGPPTASNAPTQTAPTAPAPTAPAPSVPASVPAPAPINPTVYMVNKTSLYDYIPIAVGLGVVYMMLKH